MSSTYMAPAGCTADRAYSSIFGSPIHTRQQIAAQLWRLLLLFQWKLAQFFLVVSSCYPIFQKCWYWRPSEREPRFITELFDWEFFYTHTSPSKWRWHKKLNVRPVLGRLEIVFYSKFLTNHGIQLVFVANCVENC